MQLPSHETGFDLADLCTVSVTVTMPAARQILLTAFVVVLKPQPWDQSRETFDA
jgi:hypothetical protein